MLNREDPKNRGQEDEWEREKRTQLHNGGPLNVLASRWEESAVGKAVPWNGNGQVNGHLSSSTLKHNSKVSVKSAGWV